MRMHPVSVQCSYCVIPIHCMYGTVYASVIFCFCFLAYLPCWPSCILFGHFISFLLFFHEKHGNSRRRKVNEQAIYFRIAPIKSPCPNNRIENHSPGRSPEGQKENRRISNKVDCVLKHTKYTSIHLIMEISTKAYLSRAVRTIKMYTPLADLLL